MLLNRLVREIFKERFPPKRVLFRVDAGRVSGLSFGHLSRCMTLANELKRSADSEIIFLTRNFREGVSYARLSGFNVKTLSLSLSKNKQDRLVTGFICSFNPDCLVVDLPSGDPNSYLRYARSRGAFTVCMDDTARRSYDADVILNYSILADKKQYRECPAGTRFLLGMDYFIMDDYKGPEVSEASNGYFRILITFGGSDITGLTKKVLSALTESGWNGAKYSVILGPGFKGDKPIMKLYRLSSGKVAVYRRPKNITDLFIKNDLVICAGGMTLYELHRLNKPAFAIASNKNESLVIRRFIRDKLLLSGMESWNKRDFIRNLHKCYRQIRN